MWKVLETLPASAIRRSETSIVNCSARPPSSHSGRLHATIFPQSACWTWFEWTITRARNHQAFATWLRLTDLFTGILRSPLQLIVYDLRLRSDPMDDYDPQREAEAAMKLAISTDGVDRQELIRLAMVWRELARARSGPLRRPDRAA